MRLSDIYLYYLPIDWRQEFRDPEVLNKIKTLDFKDLTSTIEARCPISILVENLQSGPTGCPHCEIQQIKSYENSLDSEERKQYIQYLQIKNDAYSFWSRFRNYLIDRK